MTERQRLLRVGDDVEFHGIRYQLTTLVGDIAMLAAGGESPVAIQLTTLFAEKSFKLLNSAPIRRRVTGPSPLFEALPQDVQARARWLEGHVTEVLDGVPCNAEPTHVPQRSYNPQLTSLRQRDLAKLTELDEQGVQFSLSKLERLRRAYERQGILGLIDQRLIRRDPVAGHADQRVLDATVKVLEQNTHQSSGTTDRLMHQVRHELDAQHGAGTVAMPSRATFHRLVGRLAEGRHATGSARTRRTLAQQPSGPFGAVYPVRPGELMQIDSTALDTAVELNDGMVGRVELTPPPRPWMRPWWWLGV